MNSFLVKVAAYCYIMVGGEKPKSSSVWNYFTYDKDTDKTTCTVLCGDSND